jgi:hypothetical protein
MRSIAGYLQCLGLVLILQGTVGKWCRFQPAVPLRRIGLEPQRIVHLQVPSAWDALVLLEFLVDVPRHGAVDMVSLVVPHEFYATEERSHPDNSHLIVFLECCLEMIEISYDLYFYAKVANDEAKGDGPPHVPPQSRRVLALIIPPGPWRIVVVPTDCLPEC